MRLPLLICLLLLSAPAFAQTVPLELTLTGATETPMDAAKLSVGLIIKNTSDHDVTIQRRIEIDHVDGFKWVGYAAMEAIAACDYHAEHSGPVIVPAESQLAVAPWTNKDCGGQCITACTVATRLLEGSYRFVVVTSDGQRIEGKPFKVAAS